jgi:hypothetical protein
VKHRKISLPIQILNPEFICTLPLSLCSLKSPNNFQNIIFYQKVDFSYFSVLDFARRKRKLQDFNEVIESHQFPLILGTKKFDFGVNKFHLTKKKFNSCCFESQYCLKKQIEP